MRKHLWDVKHPYYCAGGCYFTKEPCGQDYSSWRAFLDDWADKDEDYNLLFRWDWQEGRDYDLRSGEGCVELHYFMQRKGHPYTCRVDVTRADEPAVRAFLETKWKRVQRLWSPFSEVLCG
jgi:hypothetical protein